MEAASNFNESRYYNLFDPGAGMGGWVRMGNRPNEGYAEMTVCLYLPDGRVALQVQAAEDRTTRRRTTRAACSFEVVAPYEEHRVTYDGKVCVLAQPARDGGSEDGVQRQPARAVHRSTCT